MDDEYPAFPDPETLALHALMDGFEETLRAPARKAMTAVRAARRLWSDILQEAQNMLISRSIYDLTYQYDRSLNAGGGSRLN